jgi:hypothetical protein
MKKISVLSFLVIFTLPLSVVSLSTEEPLEYRQPSLSVNFSISLAYEQFSLKKNYTVRILEKEVHEFWMEIFERESGLSQMPVNPRIGGLERMIKRTKTKRIWLNFNKAVFSLFGGYFVYEFFTFEEQIEPERDSQSIQTKQSKFSRKRNFVFGALLTFGISAAFLNTSIQAKKKIKSYEKELKELREAQEKISSRHSERGG